MEEIISSHERIMDAADPDRQVGMIIDEWGVWTNVEPGTSQRFLYQQNTIRDAIVAALHLHIFQSHAERIHMANIAQTVNVLQAMILTDGPRMLRTPTYWVFEMLKAHQGGTVLPVTIDAIDKTVSGATFPAVSASASRSPTGPVSLSLVNPHARDPSTVRCVVEGLALTTVKGRILHASAPDAHNTFEKPDALTPTAFADFQLEGDTLVFALPPLSVLLLTLEEGKGT
jgi:alpha-N-arabinofuranosidase